MTSPNEGYFIPNSLSHFIMALLGTFALSVEGAETKLSAPVWVLPPLGLKAESKLTSVVKQKRSTNNVAIAYHGGRLFLAFRTADHHHPRPPANASWAMRWKVDRALKTAGIKGGLRPFLTERVESPTSRMYVVSAEIPLKQLESLSQSLIDGLNWRLEMEVSDKMTGLFGSYLKAPSPTSVQEKRLEEYFGKIEAERIANHLRSGEYAEASSLLNETDFREPLFLSLGGKLIFYFVSIEGEPLKFNPMRTWAMQRNQLGEWSEPAPILEPKELMWDVRKGPGDLVYASSYIGSHYQSENESATQVLFKKSKDGLNWNAAGKQGVVYEGGANEATFEFDSHGTLWSVMRLDDGDMEKGWGALLGVAPRDNLGAWDFSPRADPRRYDSPRLFRSGDEIYLLARQNLIPGVEGNAPFDLSFVGVTEKEGLARREALLASIRAGKESNKVPSLVGILADTIGLGRLINGPFPLGVFHTYEFTYWGRYAKRTALYRINKASRKIEHVETLPSAGDTAFPSIVKISEGKFLVANYSSAFDEKDWTWGLGQKNPTGIYFILVKPQ